MHTVYIIFSETNNIYYKGYTTSLEARLEAHNNGDSHYTLDKGPWVLVYKKSFESKREALIEEKRIKRLNKTSLLKLINNIVS